MFTQRMLKDYSMVGMNNSFGSPDKDLKKIIKQFEAHLELLRKYTKNEEIQAKIDTELDLWKPIKKSLESTPNQTEAKQLQLQLDHLLEISDEITTLFVDESDKERGVIVNIAGRQRMLSQRMAGLYLLKVWGVEDKEFKKKLLESLLLFKTSLLKLQASPLNSEEINQRLKRVERSFMFFEIMNRSSSKFIPTLIYQKSNDILEEMDIVTKKYVLVESKK